MNLIPNLETGLTAKRALVLVNPYARRGKAGIVQVRQLLDQADIDVIEDTPSRGQPLSDLIHKHSGNIDLVIVGGGDGSLNDCAKALLDTGLPLGVLPLGTANDFARTIGIPLDIPAAINSIVKGKTTLVDLGDANGFPFFNVASIGFSADLAMSLTEKAKKYWGKLGYGLVAARLLADSRLFTATLEHDGISEELRTLQIAVGNGRHYGGGMTVHEDATATDGLLDFYSLEVDHWWRLLTLLPSLRKGTHGQWDDVRAFSTKDLTIRTRKPRRVNLDGELKTETPVRFTIREKAIAVFVP
ncbi:diacylglycerol kinase (ATP) [Phyllobacterium ifriqiyense]|uniref:Diacylglycerol kinase (ATP) n=1 Tax=Phyllobacterium ifriqiyense TaxID=314238 RepID=A0ABU0SE98_9HYPH|nr:diacylglycerol kinase (ATP) [Phyllobacterium ifriqiyense]